MNGRRKKGPSVKGRAAPLVNLNRVVTRSESPEEPKERAGSYLRDLAAKRAGPERERLC